MIKHNPTRCITAMGALAIGASLVCGLGTKAHADPAPVAGTVFTIGGYGLIKPEYDGASDSTFGFKPIIGWRRPGAREWLDLPNDGTEFSLFETDNFRIGPVASFRFQSQSDNQLSRGFSEIGGFEASAEVGAFVEYWPLPSLRTRVEVRNAIFGAEGIVADLSADAVLRPAARWMLTAGPRLTLADQNYMDSYYGINASEAAATGLSQFKADAGVRSVGAGIGLRYQLTDNLTTLGFIEYKRLVASAADSPLIDVRGDADQVTAGVGFAYSFGVQGW